MCKFTFSNLSSGYNNKNNYKTEIEERERNLILRNVKG